MLIPEKELVMADTTLRYTNAPIDIANETDVILSNVFHSQKSLREKNRNLMLALHRLIAKNQITTIAGFMNLAVLQDFHPSLLKSILIITKQVENLQPERERVENILQQKM